MTSRLKLAIAAAFTALAVLAVVGWTRNVASVSANRYPAAASTTASYDSYGQPVVDPNPAAGGSAAAPVTQAQYDANQPASYASASNGCVEPGTYGDAVPAGYASRTAYQDGGPAYTRRYSVRQVRTRVVPAAPVYRETRVVQRRHKRSIGKSVAIVAGSAGVGAGIGALAGGGKGAGIGALAGGAGGFIYDRLTHKH